MTRLRTTYQKPTDTRGARFAVRLLDEIPGKPNVQRAATFPYDFGSSRPAETAALRFAQEVLEIPEPVVTRMAHRGLGNHLFEVQA